MVFHHEISGYKIILKMYTLPYLSYFISANIQFIMCYSVFCTTLCIHFYDHIFIRYLLLVYVFIFLY